MLVAFTVVEMFPSGRTVFSNQIFAVDEQYAAFSVADTRAKLIISLFAATTGVDGRCQTSPFEKLGKS